jgi:hypothetical protein
MILTGGKSNVTINSNPTAMKNIMKLLVLIVFVLLVISPVSAQNPTYSLSADGFSLNSPDDNMLEFDIHIYQTNAPTTFEYAGGQYFFDFNNGIANGGTLTYSRVGTGLPSNFEPRNPQIFDNGNGTSQLRLAVNTFPGAGNGFTGIPGTPPGILIERMRISNTVQFAVQNLNLVWRNGPANPFTKLFAYIGTTNTDITTAATHTVTNEITPLPVELASFTATTNKNSITLNWATSFETNNRGFEIERRLTAKSDWEKAGFVSGNGTTEEGKSYIFTERVSTGKYNYRLKQLDINGNFEYFALTEAVEIGIPTSFAISQNYPNPFNPTTKIDFEVPRDGMINIVLFDISGREVARPVSSFRQAGYYTVTVNASGLASGAYFYMMTSDGGKVVETKKMVVLK